MNRFIFAHHSVVGKMSELLKAPSEEQTTIVDLILSDKSKCLQIDSVAVSWKFKKLSICTKLLYIIFQFFNLGERKNHNCAILSKSFEVWGTNSTINIQCPFKASNPGSCEKSWFKQS